jgi:hypothetical protein
MNPCDRRSDEGKFIWGIRVARDAGPLSASGSLATQSCGISAACAAQKNPAASTSTGALRALPEAESAPQLSARVGVFLSAQCADIPQLWAAREPETGRGYYHLLHSAHDMTR